MDTLAGDVFRDEDEDADGGSGEADFLFDGLFVHRKTAAEATADVEGGFVVVHELDASVDDDAAEGERPVGRTGGACVPSSMAVKQARGSRRRASILWPSFAPWK